MPTQTPVPGITFYADAELIQQGNAVTLYWDVQDAKEVYAYRAGEDWQDKAVEPTGNAVDFPATTTTYLLRVIRNSGEEIVREVTVAVEPNPDLPQIALFTASPEAIGVGQCVELAWQIIGDTQSVVIFRGDEPIQEDAPVEGTLEDCPPAAGEYAYTLGVAGPSEGVNYKAISVMVSDEPAPKNAAAAPEAHWPRHRPLCRVAHGGRGQRLRRPGLAGKRRRLHRAHPARRCGAPGWCAPNRQRL